VQGVNRALFGRLFVAFLAFLVFLGCNSGSATPGPKPKPAQGSALAAAAVSGLAGQPLYLKLCAPCHGADAKGYAADHAPSLVNPTFLESASDDFLRQSIVAGRPGTSMAAYGQSRGGPLDDAGVDRLVTFLREQGPAPKPLPPMTPGDFQTGLAICTQRCLSCHGDAKTRGEAVSLANPQFQAAATDSFVRYAVAKGRPGTKMEAFTGKLSEAEIDAVVGYVRALGNGGGPPVKLLPEPTGQEPLVLNPSGKNPSFSLRADPCPPPPPTPPAGTPPTGTPPTGTPPVCKPDPRFVSVDQVAKAFAGKQRMVIIDARPPSEWRRVHITGAVSIPYHDMKRLDEAPKDGTWIIAYCACPHHLSGIVVDELRKRGYAHAVVLDEGINEWHRRGLPVTAAEGVQKPLSEAPPPPATLR